MKPLESTNRPFSNAKMYRINKSNERSSIEDLQKKIEQLETSIHKLICQNGLNKLRVEQVSSIIFLDYKDILYLKAESNYTRIYQTNGKSILISKTLGLISKRIKDPFFIRIHSSYFINTAYLNEFKKKPSRAVLVNGDVLPVSLANRKLLSKLQCL